MKFIQFSKPTISLEERDYDEIKEIIDSGWVSIGKNVKALEDEIKKRFNVKYAIVCSNCTQGLIISLKAAGWRNKRIAVSAFTWPSTIYSIESNIGNAPVFCDIDPDTWLIDLQSVDEDSYDAVIAVDIFGNQANIETDKPIIYDAAHGFGLYNLGHRGIAEVVSFSFTKVVSSSEGGVILTNVDEIAQTASELRRLSARMPEINAVIGLRSIKNYEENQQKKLNIIQKYMAKLEFDYSIQKIPLCTNHSVFSILLNNTQQRNAIADAFRKNNIEVKIYYEPLVERLPNTDNVFSRIISLPTYPEVAGKQDYICDLINKSVKETISKDRIAPPCSGVDKNIVKKSDYMKTYLQREVKTKKNKKNTIPVKAPGKSYLQNTGYLESCLK